MNFTTEKIGPLSLVTLITERGIKITGAYIDDFNPETQAALGATLSRDPGSIESRLIKIFRNEEMSQRILDTFFKNYGHNSIGDMGNVIFSVEDLSMMAAFSLVEHRLFNGQEASTRYLDFSEMGYLPVNDEVDKLSEKSMDLYEKILKSEIEKNISEGYSEKEAKPKAFDVAGAFLPISARTNVVWYGSIRTLIDKIRELRSMGREEKEVGEAMSLIFDKICPNSQRDVGEDYFKDDLDFKQLLNKSQTKSLVEFDNFNVNWFKCVMAAKTEIYPVPNLAIFGNITSMFSMDFRSARDIHRHRAFSVNTVLDWIPVKIERFYKISVTGQELRLSVISLEEKSMELFKSIGKDAVYGMPMAMKFNYIMSGSLDAWLYFLKLRSGPKVHPTVLKLVQSVLGPIVENKLGLKDIYRRGDADYGERSKDENKV